MPFGFVQVSCRPEIAAAVDPCKKHANPNNKTHCTCNRTERKALTRTCFSRGQSELDWIVQ